MHRHVKLAIAGALLAMLAGCGGTRPAKTTITPGESHVTRSEVRPSSRRLTVRAQTPPAAQADEEGQELVVRVVLPREEVGDE